MSAPSVVVLDYGFGNVRSALRAAQRAGADAVISADVEQAAAADGLIIPGVGAFAACMNALREIGAPRLVGRRLAGGRPVLGICVGMQVLFEAGLEHGTRTEGLGEWPGEVVRLPAPVVPHMGWSPVDVGEGSTGFAGVEDQRFYFVHSYAALDFPLAAQTPFAPPVVTWSEHGARFVAAVENGPLWATQFHPEKSGDAGARFLANWTRTLEGARQGPGQN
jgi:glutamine amidotransferase